MSNNVEESGSVLGSKRAATQYRILVQIADRQPAVSQQEVADAIGITSQAVSNYLQGLVDQGWVEKLGRGRYEVTKEGVDWLITRTDGLRELVSHVSEEVIDEVEVESALATGSIDEGDRISLTMRDGVLRAAPGEDGPATAVAVTAADAGQEVGVTDFEGVVDYELGAVTAVPVPNVRNGGSRAVDAARVAELAGGSRSPGRRRSRSRGRPTSTPMSGSARPRRSARPQPRGSTYCCSRPATGSRRTPTSSGTTASATRSSNRAPTESAPASTAADPGPAQASGSKSSAAELMQYRLPVGSGPSSKTCPRWPSHRAQTTSVRRIPWLVSSRVSMLPSS